MVQPPPDLTGAVLLGRYRLEKRIGFGGMGEVYGTDQRAIDGARLAVKILSRDHMHDRDTITRFIEEGRTCIELSHPNIVRAFEVAVAENGCPFIAMEWLNGSPLATYMTGGGRVSLVHAASILRGILAALDYAHRRGVVHRDLKPGNVFIQMADGGPFSVKLLDFGVAKILDGQKHTRTGALLGTPGYMSPEQIQSSRDVDPRTDLYSVGVLAYEMLTGKPAFSAPTEYAKLAAVLSTTPTPAAQVDPALLPVSPFLEKAMQKDRALRYQTANEMAQALEHALATSGIHADSVAIPTAPSVQRPAYETGPLPHEGASTLAERRSEPPPLVALSPGGTLNSHRSSLDSIPPARPSVGGTGTLPSNDIPVLDPVMKGAPRLHGARSGAPIWVVAIVAVVAILAGLAIGLVVAKR